MTGDQEDLSTTEFVPTAAAPLASASGPAALASDFGSVMEPAESRTADWPVATVATFLYARLHHFAET